MLDKLEVREQILDCRACELSERNPPVPFYGPVPAHIAVLGEGPGKEETKQGRPFVGPAGQVARTAMRDVGLDDEAMTWLNVTCCWPGVGTNPSATHVKSCAPNLEIQMALLKPTYMIVFGQSALGGIRPELTIRRGRGKPFLYGDTIAFAVYHPSAVLRNGMMAEPFRQDLEAFVELVDDGPSRWLEHLSDRCVYCPDFVASYDVTGIGFCPRHDPARVGDAFRR
jgi:DNA polymerase